MSEMYKILIVNLADPGLNDTIDSAVKESNFNFPGITSVDPDESVELMKTEPIVSMLLFADSFNGSVDKLLKGFQLADSIQIEKERTGLQFSLYCRMIDLKYCS